MPDFHPYIIKHLDLENIIPEGLETNEKEGFYNVYWWKHIPLGQTYLLPGIKLLKDAYLQTIWTAIFPALNFYADKNNVSIDILKEQFLKNDLNAFKETIGNLLSGYFYSGSAVVDISIVICTRNRAEYLRECLVSLQSLFPKPKEIIVIDNAPSDNRTKEVADAFKGIMYYREPRAGLDIARNSGIRKATSGIVAFMDDDIKAEPNCLSEIGRSFANEEIAAMTGLVIAAKLDTEAQLLFEKEWTFNRGYVDKVYDKKFFERTLSAGPPVWEIGAGANMAFRKSVLDKTGYFDERLDVGAAGCNGDSEIWFRILSKGYEIAYNPRAVVHHEHRKEIAGLQKQLYNYMKGFTVAAMIQQKQQRNAGYYRQLFKVLPVWYFKLVVKGFPGYSSRYRTVFAEIRGMFAGLLYFFKHRKNSAIE